MTITVEPLHTDTSQIRTVSYVPTKLLQISCKKTLSNMDNGHKISALWNKFIQE